MIKRSTKILHWFYKLSWKKIMGASAFLLMMLSFPLIQKSALERTRSRSEAALLPQPQPVTQVFETPTGPPQIYLVDHFFGKVGDAVLVHGENLGGLHEDSFVSLAGKKINTEDIVSWTGNYIEFKVPLNAESGLVEVGILGERVSWDGMFFVVDENTQAELRLTPSENNSADLKARDIEGADELLVWFLIISGEGDLSLEAVNGVGLVESVFDLPIGKVYEARIRLPSSISELSKTQLVSLVKVNKSDGQIVGVAKGEASEVNGRLIPLQVNPLYVSF